MSSDLQKTAEAVPNAPASANQTIEYVDINDNNREKSIKSNGEVMILSPNQRYNYLVNGGQDFLQRFPVALTTNTQSTAGRQMNLDQWGLTATVASCQVGRIDAITTPIAGTAARFYGQYKQITTAGKIMITQVLEGKDTANLRGKTVRFQFKYAAGAWVSGSALRFGLIQNNVSATMDTVAGTFITANGAASVDPTLGTNLNYVAPLTTGLDGCTVISSGGGVNACQIAAPVASGTFIRASALFTVPANCVNIIVAIWTDNLMGINDVLNIAECGLYLGQEIQDWSPLSYSEEYRRVSRFYMKTFNVDTTPAQNNGANTGEVQGIAGTAGAGAEVLTWIYPHKLRVAAATITTFNPAAANAQVRDLTAAADTSATATTNSSENAITVTATGNAGTVVGGRLGVHLTVDSTI